MTNYNGFADLYAEQTEIMEKATRASFYSLLPDLKGKRILDVGCGSGHDAQHYVKDGAIVYGIDVSNKQIEIARRKQCGEFAVGNMDSLSYPSDSFDLVTSVYALQALDNPKKAMLEMVRVAKPESNIMILCSHPFRHCLEGYVNDRNGDYYEKSLVTTRIFNGAIELKEPRHTLMDYFSPEVLSQANLERFEEHSDFVASEQVIPGMNYPTYMIMKFRKKLK